MGFIALLALCLCLVFWGVLIVLALYSVWVAKVLIAFLALMALLIITFLVYCSIASRRHPDKNSESEADKSSDY